MVTAICVIVGYCLFSFVLSLILGPVIYKLGDRDG